MSPEALARSHDRGMAGFAVEPSQFTGKRWWLIIVTLLGLAGCGPEGYARIDPGGDYAYSNPAWSPDSLQIAYTRCEIYDEEKGRETPSCGGMVGGMAGNVIGAQLAAGRPGPTSAYVAIRWTGARHPNRSTNIGMAEAEANVRAAGFEELRSNPTVLQPGSRAYVFYKGSSTKGSSMAVQESGETIMKVRFSYR